MSIPVFFPIPQYKIHIKDDHFITLADLCQLAGVPCRASGEWINRRVVVRHQDHLSILTEPGGGTVEIGMAETNPKRMARMALAVLAYSLYDPVARQSITGQDWARISSPVGRPAGPGRASSGAERQRKYRMKHSLG